LDNVSSKFRLQQEGHLGGAGTQTASLGFGGQDSTPLYSSNRRMAGAGSLPLTKTITVS
jgi:hypothetical protein